MSLLDVIPERITRVDRHTMRCLHLCNGLDPRRDGGMVPSILGMTGALVDRGEDVRIVTPTESRIEPDRIPRGVRIDGPEKDLGASVVDSDVVHIHGLWQAQSRLGAKAARSSSIPYLIAAHGMADPWAIAQKRWKKRIYAALVEKTNLRNASCLHALTRPEIGHLRAMAPRSPVALIPNGVDPEGLRDLPDRSLLEDEFPELQGKFTLLFLSRVHKKKGLDLLAPAMAEIAREHPELHLIVAGIDDGALAPLLREAVERGIRARITYVGHVSGERARLVWGAADAFVLPSHSEGFSMAVLEALACGLPAIITTACHFPELEAADAGIVVPPTVDGVTIGLRGLLERSPEQRRAMGLLGRALVRDQFTWARQADRLACVYRWLSGGGSPPDCVQFS